MNIVYLGVFQNAFISKTTFEIDIARKVRIESYSYNLLFDSKWRNTIFYEMLCLE